MNHGRHTDLEQLGEAHLRAGRRGDTRPDHVGRPCARRAAPSIRQLAADLRISAITTKRAYSDLEAQGFIAAVPGKGSFVAEGSAGLIREEQLRLVEENLAKAVDRARTAGLSLEELHDMLDLEWEES